MARLVRWWLVVVIVSGASLIPGRLFAPLSSAEAQEQRRLEVWKEPADAELEQQIAEVQEALKQTNQQIVRRKHALQQSRDPAQQSTLEEELEVLQTERGQFQSLLDELVGEAQATEWTAIDEALERASWLEQRQEAADIKEEVIRDRQE